MIRTRALQVAKGSLYDEGKSKERYINRKFFKVKISKKKRLGSAVQGIFFESVGLGEPQDFFWPKDNTQKAWQSVDPQCFRRNKNTERNWLQTSRKFCIQHAPSTKDIDTQCTRYWKDLAPDGNTYTMLSTACSSYALYCSVSFRLSNTSPTIFTSIISFFISRLVWLYKLF